MATIKRGTKAATKKATKTRKAKVALLPRVGDAVFIRTVTHHYTGKVVAVGSGMIALDDAAWIAEDGRFADTVAKGIVSEVEPYPDGQIVRVGIGAIVDWTDWSHDLPRTQK